MFVPKEGCVGRVGDIEHDKLLLNGKLYRSIASALVGGGLPASVDGGAGSGEIGSGKMPDLW